MRGGDGLCVAGEALIDLLPAELSDGESAYKWRVGGSPLNVCVAAARLGVPVSFLGALSLDFFGEELYEALQRERVDLSMVERLDQPTTLAFVSRSEGDADVRYAFFKENAADRGLTAGMVSKALASKHFGAVHVSLGAVTLEDASMTAAFEEFFRAARAGGGITSFDSNIRSPMIRGGSDSYRERVEEFTKLADVAKSSDADIAYLYGANADVDAVAAKWLDLGARLVVITRGPAGAAAYFRSAEVGGDLASVAVAPPCSAPQTIDGHGRAAEVVDTVGAGDTCTGALLAGLLGADGGPPLVPQVGGGAPWDADAQARLGAILGRAMASAAITCSRAGSDPPTAEELSRALAAVSAGGPAEGR